MTDNNPKNLPKIPKNSISVIVPTLNEEGNIFALVERINNALTKHGIIYEIIFIDDHSKDNTREEIRAVSTDFPVFLFLKQGKGGKAYSIMEGMPRARYANTAFIDADLQYPPEAIPEMMEKLDKGYGVVIAHRKENETSLSRRIMHWGFSFFFTRFLHRFDLDVQAGLKVFRSQVAREVKINPTAWTFDLEFLLKARNYGYKIGRVHIKFDERTEGVSKINMRQQILEIGWNSIKLKFKKLLPLIIEPDKSAGMNGAGIAHKKHRFITHTTLNRDKSAFQTTVLWQRVFIFLLFLLFLLSLIKYPLISGIIFVTIISLYYFSDVIFNLYLVSKSLSNPPEMKFGRKVLEKVVDRKLPIYSILCPLYKESEILPYFVESISKLKWPKEKLDVMLLLEEDDVKTIEAAKEMNLPESFRIVVVPHSMPKTKPKACNYGLNIAKGEYVVIYDAEDKPDPWQLKKAYLGFKEKGENVKCLQAKLNYYNSSQNLLTRMFTAEYSLWFDIVLPGLQSINTAIPLGGTSNHFRVRDLQEIGGWDPFNVTEDCDLGMRIFSRGYRTAMIDSVTLEEANSRVGNWIRQRSRWVKGYMQTYLVHMRHPFKFFKENGIHAWLFQVIVGGKVLSMMINPLLWLTTISYFALNQLVGPGIEKLFPPVVFYIAVIALIFGNFLYIYYYMIGCARRRHWRLIKYVYLVPFYWVLVSIAALKAAYQLVVKPHFWEKTKHGLHIKKPAITKPSLSFPYLLPGEQSQFVFAQISPRVSPITEAGELIYNFIELGRYNLIGVYAKLRKITPNFKNVFITVRNNKLTSLGFSKLIKVKALPLLKSEAGFFIAATMAANVINLVFSAYIGRSLSFTNLSLVVFINTAWFFVSIIIGAYSTMINHHAAYYFGAEKHNHSTSFADAMKRRGLQIIIPFTVVWLLFTPILSGFFNIDGFGALYMMSPIFIFGLVLYSNLGFFKGVLRFRIVGIILLMEAVFKLSLTYTMVNLGYSGLVYSVVPISIIFSGFISILLYKKYRYKENEKLTKKEKYAFPWRFYASSLMSNLATVAFLSFDIILAKHFFSPQLAGEYALLSIIGKMIYYGGSLPNQFMISMISNREGKKQDSKKMFERIFFASLFLVTVGEIFLGIFGFAIAPIIFGEKVSAVSGYFFVYTTAIGLFTLTNVIVSYRLAKKQFVFTKLSLIFSVTMALGIILFHSSITSIVNVIFYSALFGFLAVGVGHLYGSKLLNFRYKLSDKVVQKFENFGNVNFADKRIRRILIFNWRDTKHVFAGGAELYIHEYTKRWVEQGLKVTVFCGNDKKSLSHEFVDGVEVYRRGGFYLVYFWAFIYYFLKFRKKYDCIIDCENGIPFYTPLYAREPVYCLVHHIHQEVFRKSLIKPLALLATFLEKDLMPLVYRQTPFITVSESSKQDMLRYGLGKSGISVLSPGVDPEKLMPGERHYNPLVVYLGRLKEYKSIDKLILSFNKVCRRMPKAKLVIAGSGDEENNLKRLVKKLDLEANVFFVGHISEAQKLKLLQKAWLMVNPSLMEGWGITTIEANACATPVLASNVPGLRDSVLNNNTGILFEYGNNKELADKMIYLLKNDDIRETMGKQGIAWAARHDWKLGSGRFISILDYDYEKILINKGLNVWRFARAIANRYEK
jgi:cellulose synthase/poly-beta-1,6-N-acetylglucosamine synthase-like glycosyltransferase/glycosyltransferase involved in cell wall biosynthesis/O-antigen/teichoic acid export membrane protein